jgi:hypothetical protein
MSLFSHDDQVLDAASAVRLIMALFIGASVFGNICMYLPPYIHEN